MKIKNIRCRELTGTLDFEGEFWEDRLCRPIDIYPMHREEGVHWLPKTEEGKYQIRLVFLEVETDDGIVGLSGPISRSLAHTILSEFKSLLIGANPLAVELLWDKLYRLSVHGRKGSTMMAISAVDCALWDIRGKALNVPVYVLLGGPTRERIPAYASMLGFSVEPERAAARARAYADKGYQAQKWFFRAGPAEGYAGIERNVALVKAVREAVGPNYDLMFDCWMSWDLRYARQMAECIAEYQPRWIEEPVLPDKAEICAQIRQNVPFPVSNGEHEYTRWGFHYLLDLGAQDILQPDVFWAGGITEMVKIATLASAYDVAVIPHGHSTYATAHLIASSPPNLCPIQEYLIKWNTMHDFFFTHKPEPVNGYIELPQQPGIGWEIDEGLVEEEIIIS
ncbi:MAG: mandelate racemase/muconate lactonizing protein [Anaerolineae bacterium]|nr:mandelate racemase/muconate lactonizing protein [Anaerolineae bacterium]